MVVNPRFGMHDPNHVGAATYMCEPPQSQTSCKQQLEELLEDPDFQKIVDLVGREVTRLWSISPKVARGVVFSAIGEPATLARIHKAWFLARSAGESLGLAKVIIRRRVIDLLGKDARRAGHDSLPATVHAIDMDRALALDELLQHNPRVQLELQQIIQMVRSALVCFSTQGQTQERQARLLRRYALDEVNYSELSVELACSENALRVRVHKAMLAFRKHIRACHDELEDLLERDRRKVASGHFT